MSRNIETTQSDLTNEQHSIDGKQLRNATIEEVLLWEAT